MFKQIIAKNRSHWSQDKFLRSALFGVLLLIGSLIVNYNAGNFATEKASNGVTDIILDNIPVVDVGFIFIYGIFALFFLIFIMLFYEPRYVPFALKTLALFIFIRAIFVILTHIGTYPEIAPLPPSRLIGRFIFGGDLFFSGHTGIPFLMALIFWKKFRVRLIFLSLSIIFGASVLLGHLHYSIDVLAAFFITYTIFEIAKKFFSKSYQLIES